MPGRPRDNRTPDGAKKRWSPSDRAHRAAAPTRGRTQRSDDSVGTSRAARREATFGRPADRPDGQDRRPDWYPGGRTADAERGGRDGRPQRSDRERGGRGGDDRGFRSDASRRDDRPERSSTGERGGRTGRPERSSRAGQADRTGRPERPYRSGQDDRGARSDRPSRAGQDDRGSRDARPFRDDRSARPFRDDRPSREERPYRGARPERDDRPARSDRPFSSDRPARDDRGARDDRPARDDRGARPFQADRPQRTERSFRDDRPARPERADRPWRDDRGERPARPFREDRGPAPRRDDRGDRPDRPRSDERRRDDRPRSFEGRDGRRASRDEPARYEAPQDVVLERLEAEVVTAEEVSGSSFADLGLGQRIVEALGELGAKEPFPIQAATVPDALAGRNVLGRGRTGSGKTIAFGAALVERLMRNWADSGRTGTGRRTGRAPRALVLAPTRELALQIDRTIQPISRSVGLYTTQIVGGVPQARQVGALSKGVDIVIGTPGRIEDLLEQGRLDLSQIEITVLDEADHMAELGFLEPMQRLLRRVPKAGQRLMFSATLDSAVAQLVREFLPEPAVHEVADAEGAGTADHRVLVIDQGAKIDVLTALIGSAERVLVFARTRAFAEQLADELDGAGVKAESLHGDLNQARRTRNLQRFSEGRVAALVATDVAARGIHVDDIDLVVHADAAEDYKSYLHRSGRTGRAGASGTVVTLITARRRRRFEELLERAEIQAGFTVVRPGGDPVAALGL